MSASFSFVQYIEQALRGLMVLLSGGVLDGGAFDDAALSRQLENVLAHQPPMSALLVLETDDAPTFSDADIITARLARLHCKVRVVEAKENHMILHVTGPSIDDETLARFLAPGKLTIGRLGDYQQWSRALAPEQLSELRLELRQMGPSLYKVISAPDKESLLPLVDTLRQRGYQPFVYCTKYEEKVVECLLQVVEPELQLSNGDVTSIYISTGAGDGSEPYLSYQIELFPNSAARFAELTARNLKRPLPMVLDEEAVSMPVVQDKITGGKLQLTGFHPYGSTFSESELIVAHTMLALIGNPALSAHWRLVHVERLD